MTAILQAEHLHKSFGPLLLFSDLTLHLLERDKSALIAPNGSGKSSLLKILAGVEPPESGGSVLLHPGTSVGYLPQEPEFNPEHTLFEAVFNSSDHLVQAVRVYEEAILGNDTRFIEQAVSEMDRLQAWDYEQQIKQILTQLKINGLSQLVATLSGGERKRLALARLLLRPPDLLILDEPTNHLDIDMVEWLEEWLLKSRCTLLMVTHDRYFLDRVCNRIYELDRGILYTYHGNYTYYLEKRDERMAQQQAENERAKNLFRTELEWMRSTPQARTGKAKYRINAFYDLAGRAAQYRHEPQLHIQVQTSRMGKKIIDCKNLCHAYGPLITLDHFSYAFSRMEKIGIVGNNGVGKTTLLNILTGKTLPTSGEIHLGETVRFGYYTQEGLSFAPGQKVMDIVREIAETVTMANGKQLPVGDFLQYFLFPRNQHYTYVEKLSGGEKRRLYLLTILMQQPNFLILDEPTNDLDIMTLNVLEDYLRSFPGCVLTVSHDRHFIDKVADHLFVFQGEGKVKDFAGDYTEYRQYTKQLESRAPRAAREETTYIRPQTKQKRNFKEQREFEQLEADLATLEEEKQSIERQLSSGTLALDALHTCSARYQELLALIDVHINRWIELS